MASYRDITERKRAEEAVHQSEAHLQRITTNFPNGMSFQFLQHPDGSRTFPYVSPNARDLYELEPEEIQRDASCVFALVHPEDRAGLEQSIARSAQTLSRWCWEFRLITPSSTLKWFRGASRPERQANGDILWDGVLTDITDRKRAEEVLWEQAQILDQIHEAVVATDLAGAITTWNKGAERLYGYTAEEMRGHSIARLYPAEDLDLLQRTVIAPLTAMEHQEVEVRGRTKTGAYVWVHLSLSLLRNQVGVPYGMVGYAMDVTARKQTEEALRQEQHFVSAVLDTADALIVVANPQGQIVRFNRACERVSSYTFDEVRGKSVLELVPPEERPAVTTVLEAMFTDQCPYQLENHWVTKDGERRLISWSNTALLDARGDIEYSVGIGIDITERQRAEEALRHLSGQLLRSQDEERRRIARELHDSTAQNLSALNMFLSQVQHSHAALEPRARRLLAESLALADACFREVRTLSYLLHPPLLDEQGLASALQWYVEGFTRRSGVTVTLDMPPDLGRLTSDTELALFRIVQESLTNIHQHSGSPVAHLRWRCTAQQVILSIADAGRGMPPELLDRVRAYGSPLGVGISGMHERLRQLGGRLEIQSDRHDTTVTAMVPLTWRAV